MKKVTIVPKQIHHGNSITGKPGRLGIRVCSENSRDVVRQAAQNRDDDEADDHGDDVAEIVAARFG